MNLDSTRLGPQKTSITRLGMGGCPLGGHGWGEVDENKARDAVARAAELGINFFDTADCYGFGHSERLISDVLGNRRHDVVIATKFGVAWDAGTGKTWKDSSAKRCRVAVEDSLRRLDLESIPLYYVHWLDGTTPVEETIEALASLREAGKIQHIGVSNFTPDQLGVACRIAPISAVQVRGSLLRRRLVKELKPVARANDVRVISWGSLGEGMLSAKFSESTTFDGNDRRSRYEDFSGEAFERGLHVAQTLRDEAAPLDKTAAQLALRWLLDADPEGPGVDVALFGAKKAHQVEDNVGALTWKMPPELTATLTACEATN